MKIKVLIMLNFFFSLNTIADGYYGRFWRGNEKTSYPELRNYCDDRHSDCFVELVNRWLIPATPSYAAEMALMAYAPVLLPQNLKDQYHHEVALILYNSEEKYNALRKDKNNLEGSTYGPIHSDIFNMGVKGTKDSSRSLVPQPFTNNINLKNQSDILNEVSYEIKSTAGNLIDANGFFFLIERNFSTVEQFILNNEKLLQDIKIDPAVEGAYSLHTEDYTMLYIFLRNTSELTPQIMIHRNNLKIKWSTPLRKLNPIQSSPLLYERIGYGEGGNLQFSPGKKPGTVDHYRLHE